MTSAGPTILPVTAVIPTRQRTTSLGLTLDSLARQSAQPAEVIVVDASDDSATANLCQRGVAQLASQVRWYPAAKRGAAAQRNEGMKRAVQPVIAFFDDDILFESECVARLWDALGSDPKLGGVNATITNQMYSPPGRVTSILYPMLAGGKQTTYAGRVLGPGINLLPEDLPNLPEVVPVDWLNTTCTLYRRAALPEPPFPAHFTGYSMCEDLTLSLTVGRAWKLANARTARIYHDSQPGEHKRSHTELAEMELVNRHFVMTEILAQRGIAAHLRFLLWELFQIAAAAQGGASRMSAEIVGKLRGLLKVMTDGKGWTCLT